MNKQKLFFDSTNGADKICYFKYSPDTAPKAIFQIVHGMAEYAERYEGLAEILCKNGFVVYLCLRGSAFLRKRHSPQPPLQNLFGDFGWLAQM